MSANLDITQVSASQNQKEVTINDAIGALDAALTEGLTVDFTSGNVTLTDAEFRGNIAFIASNMAAGRELTVPEIKRLFIVNNPDASESLDVIRGTTTITVDTETTTLFYTDGTANGLLSIAGGGGGGDGTFVSLTDTPVDFSGEGGKAVRVNSGETALVFDDYPTQETNWFVPFKGALVTRSSQLTGLTLPAIIDWNEETYDTDDIWDVGSASRLTVPTGASRVRVFGCIETAADTAAGSMFVIIYKNGTEFFSGFTTARNDTTGFNNNIQACATPVLSVTPGDYFEIRLNASGLGGPTTVEDTNMSFFAMEVVEMTAAEQPAVTLGSFLDGAPATDEKVLRGILAQNVTLPASGTGSYVSSDVAANAQTDFDLQKNGVSIGTIRFAAAATDATFVSVSATDFDAGDVVTIVAPNPADSTLADLSFVLKFTLR